jgi:uncharacterized protein DUF3606
MIAADPYPRHCAWLAPSCDSRATGHFFGTSLAASPVSTGDKSKLGKPDRDRINVDEDYEVRDWAKSLGVTEDQLRSAVAKAGPMVKDVKAHLQGRD